MTIVPNKENHFVPVTFLQSWATKEKDKFEIYTFNLKDNFTRKQTTTSVAKKKNLYTIPLEYRTDHPDYDPKITEHIIFKTWEDRWPLVLAALKNNRLNEEQTQILKGFIITQSFRTPKFQKENDKIIEKNGDPDAVNRSPQIDFAFLGMKGLTEYIKECVCEVFFINDLNNFICSDNPSTHWFFAKNKYSYIDGIAYREDLFNNPTYKIICPITPKHIAILTPNLGITINDKTKKLSTVKTINYDFIKLYNRLIEHGADKLLFAKKISDLYQ